MTTDRNNGFIGFRQPTQTKSPGLPGSSLKETKEKSITDINKKDYIAVKNYIHNDLKITKEDINLIIEKTVQDQVQNLLKDNGILFSIIRNVVGSSYREPIFRYLTNIDQTIYNEVTKEVCKQIKENIVISLKDYTDDAIKKAEENR